MDSARQVRDQLSRLRNEVAVLQGMMHPNGAGQELGLLRDEFWQQCHEFSIRVDSAAAKQIALGKQELNRKNFERFQKETE